MWFLEHESLFGGKRVWLRPGSQQLFGRTKSTDKDEGTSWKIDNKAVSRKHVMLKVHDVAEGNGTKLHTRSQVEITDLSCRQGITIDEKTMLKSQKADDGSLKYERTILTGTDHTIRLAQGYPPFRIVWQPVVFTYASRESKESKARSAQLHALDIKTTTDFVFDKTTHVVSQKRNLPKVLSGLVAGKYIVTSDFLDLVLQLAKASVDEAENYRPSKLEEDFDTWWPKEKDYIPPVGAEPVPRPQEMLLPDSARSEVFLGLTFIFMVQSQYSSLLEPVSGGSGKGLFFEAKPGETTVQEYVDYVHSVAGRKKRSHAGDGKLPIITVRLGTYPDGMEDWASSFVIGVDQALNQRSIMQNEFLDAILTKDRAALQRPPSKLVAAPLEESPSQMAEQEPTHVSQPKAPTPEKSKSPDPEETRKTIPRKRAIRAKTTSRFTGFDDYEPPPKRSKVEAIQMEDIQQTEPSTGVATQSRVIPSSQQESGDASHIRTTIEKEEQLDTLFPAAAAIKRKRAATRAPSASIEPEAGGAVKSPKSKGKVALERLQRTQAKIDNRELNVREKLEQRVKEEDERRKADEDALREALDGIDIAEMRNLAVIEEMEIKPRTNRGSTRQTQDHSERWNPDWNGRKNFKKFRRRGADRGVQGNKVIVTLEEAAAKKTFDTFYLSDNEAPSTFRSARSGDHQQEGDSGSEPEPGFTKRSKNNRKKKGQNEVVVVEDSEPEDEEMPVRRTQRSSGRSQRVDETQVVEATPEQGTARARKRSPAVTSSAGQAATKRRKLRRDDDSDEEETGFRFKRRG